MIGSTIVKQMVRGTMRLVQVVRYSNGKTVKRLLDANGMPEEILD